VPPTIYLPAGPGFDAERPNTVRNGVTPAQRGGGRHTYVAKRGGVRLRRAHPTQRNDRLLPPRTQRCQKGPVTCGFGARGGIRTLALPIRDGCSASIWTGSRRIWAAHVECLVGPDGSRRIQTDRLDDHRDDQGASDRTSDAIPRGGTDENLPGSSCRPLAAGWVGDRQGTCRRDPGDPC